MNNAKNGRHASNSALLKKKLKKTLKNSGCVFLSIALVLLLWPAGTMAFAEPDAVAPDSEIQGQVDDKPAPSSGEGEGSEGADPSEAAGADQTDDPAKPEGEGEEGAEAGSDQATGSEGDEATGASDEQAVSSDEGDGESKAVDASDETAENKAADESDDKAAASKESSPKQVREIKTQAEPKREKVEKDVGESKVTVDYPDNKYNKEDVTVNVTVSGLDADSVVTVAAESGVDVSDPGPGETRKFTLTYAVEDNEEREFTGEITVNVGEDASESFSNSFVVDKHAPEVDSFEVVNDPSDTEGDTNYYNLNGDAKLTVTVKVKDRYLDTDNSKIAISGLTDSSLSTSWEGQETGYYIGTCKISASQFVNSEKNLEKASFSLDLLDQAENKKQADPDGDKKYSAENALVSDDSLDVAVNTLDGTQKAEIGGKDAYNGPVRLTVKAKNDAGYALADETSVVGMSGSVVNGVYTVDIEKDGDYSVSTVNVKTQHGATGAVSIEGAFIIAQAKPVLSINLNKEDAMTSAAPYVFKNAGDVKLELAVENPLSIASKEDVKLTINGSSVAIQLDDDWKATVSGDSIEGLDTTGETSYQATLSATNVFADKIDDGVSPAFAVDSEAPEVEFAFDDFVSPVTWPDVERPISGKQGVVRIKVTDPNLGSNPSIAVKKNGEEISADKINWTEVEGGVQGTVINCVPDIADENTEDDWVISVDVKDSLGNAGQSEYFYKSDLFTIDTKPVEIGDFDFGDAAHETSDEGFEVYAVTSGDLEGKLLIKDRDLDTHSVKTSVKKTPEKGGRTTDGPKLKFDDQPVDFGSYSYEVSGKFEPGYVYDVTISANDYAKNGVVTKTIRFAVQQPDSTESRIELRGARTGGAGGRDYIGSGGSDGKLEVLVVVSVAFFAVEPETTVSPDDGSIEDSGWSEPVNTGWTKTYTKTLKFPESKYGEFYDISVSYDRPFGGQKTYRYGDTSRGFSTIDSNNTNLKGRGFVVDFTEPQIEVDYNPANAAGTLDDVDYYGENLEATIKVTDATLDPATPANIVKALEDEGVTATITESEEGDQADGSCTIVASYTESEPGKTHQMSFNAVDLAKHKSEYSYKDDKGASGFIVDLTDPVLTVRFDVDEKPVGTNGSTDYFDAKSVTVTVTAQDNFIDPDKLSIKAEGGKVEGWTDPDKSGKCTAVVTYNENEAGADPYNLSVSVQDKLYTAAGSASEYASHRKTWNYADDYGIGGEGFVVDGTTPKVSVSMDQPVATNRGGTDYYGNAKEDVLTATIEVVDNNFDKEGSPINPTILGTVVKNWKQDATDKSKWTAKVEYSENLNPTASDLKLRAADFVQTYGKNLSNDHEVKYDYGEENTTAGGAATSGKRFILDLTAPDLIVAKESVRYSNREGGQKNPWLFYTKSGAGLQLTITDAVGIAKAQAESPFSLSGEPNNVGTKATKKLALIEGTSVGDRDSKINIMHNQALVTLTDYVGNWRMWNISPDGKIYLVKSGRAGKSGNTSVEIAGGEKTHPEAMVLDTKAPVVNWSSAPKAGGYFNTTQSATLSITELNFDLLQRFDGGRVIYTVFKQAGNAGRAASSTTHSASEISGSGDSWSKAESFAEDGHYRLEAQFEDIAGNMSNKAIVEEFTIDKTAPKITITWDNNDVRNGKYYKAGRTATVTVEEHNFDPNLVKFNTNGAVGGWSNNGDTHVCQIAFTTDGDYHLSMSMTDKAGNAAQKEEADFTVDLTAPKISFQNVENEHAYNDDVIAPVVVYEDEKNFDAAGMDSVLTGAKYGERGDITFDEVVSGNTGTHEYENFPDVVESDDIYTIDAHLVDLAGNEAEGSITFSVNRYGSNFIILNEKEYKEGVLDAAPEVVVQEINVNGSDEDDQSVSVSHGLKTDELERIPAGNVDSEGFFVKTTADAAGWTQNEYHVGKGNFAQKDANNEIVTAEVEKDGAVVQEVQFDDGNYHVVINDTDRATNLNNSAQYYNPKSHKTDTAEVEFTLDTHAPVVDGLNVTDGGFYAEGNKELTFTVTDNVGVKSVEVTFDETTQDLEVTESGVYSVVVPEAFVLAGRNVLVRAIDVAGNTGEGKADGIHVFGVWQLLIALAAVGGIGGGAYYVRRRGMQQ